MTRVTLLTKPDCDLCDHAKEVLARIGTDHAIDVETVELESDRGRALAMTSGMAFPPAVFVDGEPFSYGRLSERKLRTALGRRNTAR